MRTYMLQTVFKRSHALAGVILAAIAFSPTSQATGGHDYKPADLVHGHCGSGHITIKVKGHKEVVSCSNLDTHTGKGYYSRKMCHHKGKDYRHGYKHKRCEYVTHYYQLPVIEIQKFAYKDGRVITTNRSPEFHFNISTNGSYHKGFKLKSKQRQYFIVGRDTYTIAEHARGYKTRIECNGRSYHDYKVDVTISKPGQQVKCNFLNSPKHRHTPKPDHKPKHCAVAGHSLGDARAAYAKACHYIPRKDCDYVHGKWYCSSQQIGHAAPNLRY